MVTRSSPPPHAPSVTASTAPMTMAGAARRPPPARVRNGTCTSKPPAGHVPVRARTQPAAAHTAVASARRERGVHHAAQPLDGDLEIRLAELAERNPKRVTAPAADMEGRTGDEGHAGGGRGRAQRHRVDLAGQRDE